MKMKKPFFQFPEIKKSGFPKRFSWKLWLLVHLGIPVLLGLSMFFASPLRVNTLLLDMIPQAGRPKAAAADSKLGERNSRETVILAASTDFEKAKNAAILLHDEFINSSGFDNVSLYFDPPLIAEFAEYLYKYRFVIAGKETL